MSDHPINVLLTSFRGLGLPPTLVFPISSASSVGDLRQRVIDQLPHSNSRFVLTTTSNKEVIPACDASVTTLLSSQNDTFLPLRLSVPLCGGKGGFGSQLRAAGGRMSSKRKKNQGDANSSNRNLDGRRLRTVNEAKALAEYLALKPDMERKEKEARRKRWEQVVEMTERREEEARNGSKGKVDGQWVEDKEEAGERARAAVLVAMGSGEYHDNLKINSSGSSGSAHSSEEEGGEAVGASKGGQLSVPKPAAAPSRMYTGFDEDDEFMSDSEDSDEDEEEDQQSEEPVVGKGKGRAIA